MVMQPLSDSELQDSSEDDSSFDGESDTECSLESQSTSDPSSESGEDTEDPYNSLFLVTLFVFSCFFKFLYIVL